MNERKQIENIVKVVRKLTFNLRTNMTSVTRYVKHEREKSPTLTTGEFIDRHLKYRDMAKLAVNNILECINSNEELRQIESMRFDDTGYRKQEWISVEDRLPDVLQEVFVYRGNHIGNLMNVYTYVGGDMWQDELGFGCRQVDEGITHWMPLPEPPKMKGK